MAKRTASAKKQARAGARRTVRNRGARSEVKTLIVKARRALGTGTGAAADRDTSPQVATTDALRALDRAAAKGILHRNNVARRKSRLARQLAKVAAAAPPPPAKGKKGAAAPSTASAKKK